MRLATWRQLREVIRRADLILEVLDSRDPETTRSLKAESIIKSEGKDFILVLNKCDLIPRIYAEEWKKFYERKGLKAVYISTKHRRGTRILRREILRAAITTPVIVAIIGFPKVGKSSIINVLKGKHSAQTSPYPGTPGYTKNVQLYKIDNKIYMIDTPGVIPVEGGELETVIRGRPIEKINEPVNIAIKLIEKIQRYVPSAFLQAYGTNEKNPIKLLEFIAVKRGWFYKTTHEPNLDEAARALIRDFLNGKIPYYVPPPTMVNKNH